MFFLIMFNTFNIKCFLIALNFFLFVVHQNTTLMQISMLRLNNQDQFHQSIIEQQQQVSYLQMLIDETNLISTIIGLL